MRATAPHCPNCLKNTDGKIKRKTRIHNTKGIRRYFVCDTCGEHGSFDCEREEDKLRDALNDKWLPRLDKAINLAKKGSNGKKIEVIELTLGDAETLVNLIKNNQ